MSECVDKLPHDCGSRRGLQVFKKDDRITGYCFACGTYVEHPYGDGSIPVFKPKSKADRQAEVDEIYKEYPVVSLPARKLKADSLKYFGVRVAVSEQDGETPIGVFFPYGNEGLSGLKYRDLNDKKRMYIIGETKPAKMFGWGRAIRSGQRTLYITEGEFDAIALYQILKDGNRNSDYANDNPAVVSLKNGAGGAAKDIMDHLPEIKKYFESVVLVFDNDAPGQEAAEKVAKVYPGVSIATLPCKDANECLIEGASKACRAAVLFRNTKAKNTRLVYGSSLSEIAHTEAQMGLSWPWPTLTDLTRGIRRQETIYFGAGVKMGKSELVNTIAAHMILEHKKKVFLIKPEEALPKSYKMLVGKAAGRIFHDPKIQFDHAAWEEYEPLIRDNAVFCDVYQFVSWERLKEDIVYTVVHDGVEDVMIDPITCLTNQMGSAEANEELTALTAELSALSKDHNFTAYIFCHLKAPSDSVPHERGGKVLSTQFAGSRAMMRSCNYMIGMQGNKDPELPVYERNMRYLELLEDREFGASGRIPLYWDSNTGLFTEAK